MRKTSCVVRGCSSKTGEGISMFKFPRENNRIKEWLKACNREDLLRKTAAALKYNYKICEFHFEDKFKASGNRTRLFDQAKPTIFLDPGLNQKDNALSPSPVNPVKHNFEVTEDTIVRREEDVSEIFSGRAVNGGSTKKATLQCDSPFTNTCTYDESLLASIRYWSPQNKYRHPIPYCHQSSHTSEVPLPNQEDIFEDICTDDLFQPVQFFEVYELKNNNQSDLYPITDKNNSSCNGSRNFNPVEQLKNPFFTNNGIQKSSENNFDGTVRQSTDDQCLRTKQQENKLRSDEIVSPQIFLDLDSGATVHKALDKLKVLTFMIQGSDEISKIETNPDETVVPPVLLNLDSGTVESDSKPEEPALENLLNDTFQIPDSSQFIDDSKFSFGTPTYPITTPLESTDQEQYCDVASYNEFCNESSLFTDLDFRILELLCSSYLVM